MKLPINPKAELFKWGPIPVHIFSISAFLETLANKFHVNYAPHQIPTAIVLFKDKRMIWMNDFSDLRVMAIDLFKDVILPKDERLKLRKKYEKSVKNLSEAQKQVEKTDLAGLSETEFLKLWKKYFQKAGEFVDPTFPMEFANFGSDAYLKTRLEEHISDDGEINKALEILTAPEEMSYYQEEEMDLYQTNDIKEHQSKYYWLQNGYGRVEVLPVEFFEKRKTELSDDIMKEILESVERSKARKEDLKKKYDLPEEIMEISKAITYAVEWQDARKKEMLANFQFEDLLLKETSKRTGYSEDDLHLMWYYEVSDLLEGNDYADVIKERKKGAAFLFENGVTELDSKTANEYWEIYVNAGVEEGIEEFKGVLACAGDGGKIKGKIKILLDPYNVESFAEGDILVAPMTSPEYIFAMKRAKVIITDEGGLTSHAAVVSREMNTPCIVGAKIATKVLKDGMEVEVDADKGVVRIIE